jgi:CheY-like chemotaxis protein
VKTAAAGAASATTAVPARRRVLVADDNRDAADTTTMLLRALGHEVHTVYDGMDAVAAAETFRPDLMLLDIGMPGLNGFEVARTIREQSWGDSVTLVAVSGWGQPEDRARSEAAGFDRHLVKPVEMRELTAAIGLRREALGA